MSTVSYPAGGWLPAGAHFEPKWDDQGFDLATNWNGIIQAPGRWRAIEILGDSPFPNGFGPHYLYVQILDGPWAKPNGGSENSGVFYLGHDTAIVRVGDTGEFGHPLALANEGRNWAGTNGGWLELGNAYPGSGIWLPGPKRSSHWFDSLIRNPLVVGVPNPPLHFGDTGLKVMGVSRMLVQMGYMAPKHYKWTFDQEMHLAVKRFRIKHKLCPAKDQPGIDHGIVDDKTDAEMRKQRDISVRTHKPDWP